MSVSALSVVNVFDLAGARAAPTVAPGFSEGVVRFPGVAGHKVAVGVGVLDVGVEATGAGVTAGAGDGADVGRQHRFATTNIERDAWRGGCLEREQRPHKLT